MAPVPDPLPHLPLLRFGEVYESLDTTPVRDHRSGETMALVSVANAGLIRRDLSRAGAATAALREVPHTELLTICHRAGELFLAGDLPLGDGRQTPAEYVRQLSAVSGLPQTLCRGNMQKIHHVLTRMPLILKGLTRSLPGDVFDGELVADRDLRICYYVVAASLGVVLPSNSPGVNSLWLPAIAMKVPAIVKPGREEPWTPWRLMQAFIAAGCPPAALGFYPTTHEGADAIVQGCGRAIVFGDQRVAERYAARGDVSVHGPGHSKVLIGEDCIDRWPEFLDVIVASIAANGGRSCINASTVLVPRRGRELAEELARRLAAIRPRAMDDDQAALAAFANPQLARHLDGAIEDGLQQPGAVEVTARYREGDRLVVLDGSTFLQPTVVFCDAAEHVLARREFLFPYAAVVEAAQGEMGSIIGPSLAVTAITDDPAFRAELVSCPDIDRLNLGPVPTSTLQWDQPHEGNLFEFLYRRRAIQTAGA